MVEVENCRGVGAAVKFLTSRVSREFTEELFSLLRHRWPIFQWGKIVGQIPIEPIFPKQVQNTIVCFCFLFLTWFAHVHRMMGLDEIDPTMVEGTEAAVNLETAGYPELRPFLRCVRRSPCVRNMRDWERSICHHLTTLRVVPGPFPVTVDLL